MSLSSAAASHRRRTCGRGANYEGKGPCHVGILYSYDVLHVDSKGNVTLAPGIVADADDKEHGTPEFKHDARFGGAPGTLLAKALAAARGGAPPPRLAPMPELSMPPPLPPVVGSYGVIVLEATAGRGNHGVKGGRNSFATIMLDLHSDEELCFTVRNGPNDAAGAPFAGGTLQPARKLPVSQALQWLAEHVYLKCFGRGAHGSEAEALKKYTPVFLHTRGLPIALMDDAVHAFALKEKSKELLKLQSEDDSDRFKIVERAFRGQPPSASAACSSGAGGSSSGVGGSYVRPSGATGGKRRAGATGV